MKLAFLGDSITYGADGYGIPSIMAYPLPLLVQMELGARESVNLGISGSTLCAAIDTRPDAYDHCPYVNRVDEIPLDSDIVCVFGGVNDFEFGFPLGTINDEVDDTIYGALNGIVKQLQSKYPNAYLLLFTPMGLADERIARDPATYKFTELVDAIKQVGAKYGVDVVDLYNDSGWKETEMLADKSDGLHPSQYYMARHVAPMIANFIRANYRK